MNEIQALFDDGAPAVEIRFDEAGNLVKVRPVWDYEVTQET